jgi:hypothetical protein
LRRELLFRQNYVGDNFNQNKKVVSTRSDNSRMKNLTFSIKNVKKLSELTCATSALVLSVTWAGAKLSQWDRTSHKT